MSKRCIVNPDPSTCQHCIKVGQETDNYILNCKTCKLKNVECEILKQWIANPGYAIVRYPNGETQKISRSRISVIWDA